MNKDVYAVIMAGGIGSRFWPISVEEYPKQFIDVLGVGKTLVQLTYERLLESVPKENFYIVTNHNYVSIVKKQLPDIDPQHILAEPVRKNTAPCITYAAAKIYSMNKNATLIVTPSDHLILKQHRFIGIVQKAVERAQSSSRILTLGIKPTRPDTGYGYIHFQQEDDVVPGQIVKVKQFTEKPNREMAELFLKSGDYCWNSGIFIWGAATILYAIQKFQPDLHELFCSDLTIYNSDKELEFIEKAFSECENISIDFAVMENAKNVDVVLSNFEWSDIGTWGSLSLHLRKDVYGNSVKGKNTHLINSNNCLINLPDNKIAIIQGLKDKIIVESDNKLLILDKNDEQNLKSYLQAIDESE